LRCRPSDHYELRRLGCRDIGDRLNVVFLVVRPVRRRLLVEERAYREYGGGSLHTRQCPWAGAGNVDANRACERRARPTADIDGVLAKPPPRPDARSHRAVPGLAESKATEGRRLGL